jgi:hypothetical protein
VQFADVLLRVKLNAELLDQLELRLEEVDVLFLALHYAFEKLL